MGCLNSTMKMSKARDYILLHLIVLIFGFTGILGKLITLDSDSLVWYRMMIASLGLVIYALIAGKQQELRSTPIGKLVVIGAIIAVHWITFFEAINQSNVSVALATMSSTSLFVAVFTPLFERKLFRRYEIFLGLLAIAGLVMIFGFETHYITGIVLALISSALAAVFTLANAQLVKKHGPVGISTYELLFGALVLTIYLAFTGKFNASFWEVSNMDWLWLILLALVATSFAFVISVEVMKRLSPFTVSISVNLEPIYAILLALLIFGESEEMSYGFYIGAALILVTIFANAYLKRRIG